MATAVSARPVPLQKMKRPPLPMVQTSANGVKSSQSSPSPSLSSKRPLPGFKHPPSLPTTNGTSGTSNAAGPRISNRRKESQRPGDSTSRPPRSARLGTGDGAHIDRKFSKRMPEPYVKTTAYMLKKYRKAAPSLILHLHPTHFRFEQQDGSFSYNSPMRTLLEHVKSQTIPHDMLDDLKHAGVKFYENCLLIQIQDHRNNSAISQAPSLSSIRDTNIPFSIHNYNEHLTPSPYVPYPIKSSDRAPTAQLKAGSSAPNPDSLPAESEKENVIPKDQATESSASTIKGPKTFTTVLFSTPMSLQEELLAFANMVDHRANNRKQSQISARTPASATLPHPPTPSSAVPPTPFSFGPTTKKQKMMFNGKDLAALEEKLINATAPPLYLDPVNGPQEAEKLMRKLQDPLFCHEPPSPKTRKRTIAELAADEALAAEEQRFMLIMDERLVPSSTAAGAGKAAATDGEAGAASFEPRFERFKAIEDIRLAHQEKAQRETEMKAQAQLQQQAAKVRAEQAQRENQQQAMALSRHEAQKKQEQMRRMQNQQMHQSQQMMHQQQMPPGLNQHGHPLTSNGMIPSGHQMAVSQAHHSSPVVRNMTPTNNNSSPLVNNVMMSQSVPMNVTSSSQGAGSPPRPGSAMQHGHPSVGPAMSIQRSQQPPSRNGTPQMPNGTPRLGQATPVMANVTPTPRISQSSPGNPSVAGTPVLGHNMMATPHMNGQPVTAQQQHMFLQQQRAAQLAQHQQQMQGSPPNNQMSSQNLQQLAAHHAHQQNQQQRMREEAYKQQLQALTQNQMSSVQGAASQLAPNNLSFPQQMQMAQQQQQQGRQSQAYWSEMYKRRGTEFYSQMMTQAKQKYGSNVPPQVQQSMHSVAAEKAKAIVRQMQAQQQQQAMAQGGPTPQQIYAMQQQQQQQQQQMGHVQNVGMMGGNMGGMNGMGM